jgi:hypothetical protein
MKNLANLTAAVAATVLTLSSCKDAPIPQGFQGIWLAPAYGQGLEITANKATLFDYTENYCFINLEEDDANEALINFAFRLNGDQLEQKLSYGANDLYSPGILFDKAERKPEICRYGYDPQVGDSEYKGDILTDLDYFYETLKELSISIELQQVDWDSIYVEQREALAANPTEAQLTEALLQMIKPLRDGHTSYWTGATEIDYWEYFRKLDNLNKPLVMSVFAQEYKDINNLREITTDEEMAALLEYVENQLTLFNRIIYSYADNKDKIQTAANDQLTWFQTNGVGYLSIANMSDFAEVDADDDLADMKNLNALEPAIDRAIADLADTKGLIIDIRTKYGKNAI